MYYVVNDFDIQTKGFNKRNSRISFKIQKKIKENEEVQTSKPSGI